MDILNRHIVKLLSLKNEYLSQVEQENPGHEEKLILYTECIAQIRNVLKDDPSLLPMELIKSQKFHQCLLDLNGNDRKVFCSYSKNSISFSFIVLAIIGTGSGNFQSEQTLGNGID